jgi:tetratricopeptide (TPR) repeat protein
MEEAVTAAPPTSPSSPSAASDQGTRGPRSPRRLMLRLALLPLSLARHIIRRPGHSLVIALLVALILFGAWMAAVQAWAYYHFRAGRAAVEKYHVVEAFAHLQACLQAWPRDPDALLLAARAARRVDQFDLAEELLDRCAALPNRPHEELAIERLCLFADRGDLDDVMETCWKRVKAEDTGSPLILEAMISGAIRVYRLRLASKCLEYWLERDPDNTRALFLQSVIQEQRDDRVAATESLLRALAIDPELDQARLRAAIHMVESSAAQDAMPHLDYLRRRQPENAMIQLLQARCHDLLGESDEAIKILDELIERHPDFGQALAERAKFARRAADGAEAERLLTRAAVLEPGDYIINHACYQCLVANGKLKEAKKLDAHLAQLQDDVFNLQKLVQFRMEGNPSDPELHYQAGSIALRAGAVKEGVRWLESAVKLDPKHAPSHRMLAVYYQRMGQPGKAASHLEQARAAEKDKPPDTSKKTPKS